MNFHHFQIVSQSIVKSFPSASLITDDGKLIASYDQADLVSTTSRLVVFHIVKKYLQPHIGDMIIMNDPENGGLDYQHIFFVSRLTEDLYLVFVQQTNGIDFKIPPTPLFEKKQKNKLIWSLLVEPNPNSSLLASFFEQAFETIEKIILLKKDLSGLSDKKNQNTFFKTISQIFELKFNNQALGFAETSHKLSDTEQIKFKLSVDEKVNQRTVLIDFSQTSLATDTSAASHVIESILIQKLASFYKMSNLVSQPFLDHIRVSLPPKSIVSKATATGSKNLFLQKTISEIFHFLLESLTVKANKSKNKLELPMDLMMSLHLDSEVCHIHADSKKFHFENLESVIHSKKLIPLSMNSIENKISMRFKIGAVQKASFQNRIKMGEVPQNFLVCKTSLNKKADLQALSEGDEFEFNWKIKN